MRRLGLIAAVFLPFMFILPRGLHALDLQLSGGAGNLAFDTERENSLGAGGGQFEPNLYPFGILRLEGEYSDRINFFAAYERDPVLRNRLLANIGVSFSFMKLEFGPFIGLFNTEERPLGPGIAAALRLEFPGICFGSLKTASTIGSLAAPPGDFVQEAGEISLGFWVPHVICTFSINSKGFTQRKTDALLIKDEHTRYQFQADVFSKNVPYTIRVDMGYQILKRSYTSSAGGKAETDELKSVYAGFEGTYRINPSIKLILGAEMPVYTWGEKPLRSPERASLFYQVHGGFIWTLPARKS
jgi:hypothetical protein